MSRFARRRLGRGEQALFAKRLAFLMDAGVPIGEALGILRDQSVGASRTVLERILADVSGGRSLSKSLAASAGVFGEFGVHMVQVGEATGALPQSLKHLSLELMKRDALTRKIVHACIYPAVITLATIGITIFLVMYLFPKIVPVFASLRADVPFSTRAVMSLSDFLAHNWLTVLVGAIAAAILAVTVVKKSARVRRLLEHLSLRLPVVGGLVRSYNLATGCRTLGLLLSSGMPFGEALTVTADTTRNGLYRQAYRELGHVVLRGDRFSRELARSERLFPPMAANLIAVGERSGTLAETLLYISDMHDAEVEDSTKNLSTLIEPALMILMGVVIGFIATSIITPIYSITSSLHA